MTSGSFGALEGDILAAVRHRLESADRRGWPERRSVRSVTLEQRPQTAELVVLIDDWAGEGGLRTFERRFPLEVYKTEDGNRMSPALIASIVWANVTEPIRKGGSFRDVTTKG